jgi:mRNA-degrading endonuclease YafQ of YafQ-DinJ toxin-antitoxin module
MAIWRVEYEKPVRKQIADGIRAGSITQEDLEVIEKWVDLIEKFGPEQIQNDRTWYDHELFENWKGHRSSAFHFKGRIIYRIEGARVVVVVVKITKDHDYGRK